MKDFPIKLLKQNSRERLIIERRVFKLLDQLKSKHMRYKIITYCLVYSIAFLSLILTCLNIYAAQSNTVKNIKIISLISSLIGPVIILFNQMLNNLSLKKKVILYKTNINKIEQVLWSFIQFERGVSFDELIKKINKIRSVVNDEELYLYNTSISRNITPQPIQNSPILSK
jgi:uncharacterized membrane protein